MDEAENKSNEETNNINSLPPTQQVPAKAEVLPVSDNGILQPGPVSNRNGIYKKIIFVIVLVILIGGALYFSPDGQNFIKGKKTNPNASVVDSQRIVNGESIAGALQNYYEQNLVYPDTLQELMASSSQYITTGLSKTIDLSSMDYSVSADKSSYSLCVILENPSDATGSVENINGVTCQKMVSID